MVETGMDDFGRGTRIGNRCGGDEKDVSIKTKMRSENLAYGTKRVPSGRKSKGGNPRVEIQGWKSKG
jgi:hypothetical protein